MAFYRHLRQDVASHPETRGWVIGDFVPEGSLFKSSGLELKYSEYAEGEDYEWERTENANVHSMAILVSGELDFICAEMGRVYHLELPGDYVYFDTDEVSHHLQFIKDTTLLTLRWPKPAIEP